MVDMEPSARSKGSAGGNRSHSLTKQMALEAADMEARLASLRAAMAKEKTKREAALASAGAGGAIWNHGAAATKSKGAQPLQQSAPARSIGRSSSSGSRSGSSAGATVSSSRTGTATRPGATAQPAAPPGAPREATQTDVSGRLGYQAGSFLQDKSSLDRSGNGRDATTLDTIKPQALQPSQVAAAVASAPRSQSNQPSLRANPAQGYAATSTSRPSDTYRVKSPGGIGTSGGDDGLLGGVYDEAASRNSFQEALNEWRRAGKADRSCSSTASSSTKAQSQSIQSAGQAPAVSAMDVQTDSRGLGLRLNADSSMRSTGTAGGMAVSSTGNTVGGSYFLKMLARNSSSNRTACADGPAVQPTFVRQPPPQDSQQHDQQQPDAAHGSISSETTAEPALAAQQAVHVAAEDEELDSSSEALPGFDAWLQTAEQHVEQAITSSNADGSCADQSIDTGVLGGLCAGHRSADGYEQEMQQLLYRLEHLEDRQRAATGATSDSNRPQAVVQHEAEGSSSGVVYFTAGLRLPDAVRLPVNLL